MPVIEVSGLTKTFRTYKKQPGFGGAIKGLFRRQYEQVSAVNDISFKIEPGELVGFLGPNGAGKTTTLKMLSGLLYPSAGTAKVLGHVPWKRDDEYRRQFALVLGQKNQLWWDLPARESLELNAKIYGIPKDRFERTVKEMSELLNVQDKMNVSVRELSLGERMKMELIASLLHQPKVLFLDEPTIGLDVISQKTVREFLRRHNKEHKTTILLTSHYMTDIQELCERVIIIDHGKLFFDGLLSDVVDRFADFKLITIHCDKAEACTDEGLAKYGEVVEKTFESIKLKVKRDRVIPTCKALLDDLPVTDIDIEEVPIRRRDPEYFCQVSMKSLTEQLWFEVPGRRGFVNITPTIESLVKKSGVQEGLCLVNAMHITASVFINDAEDGLLHDYEAWLEELAPHEPTAQYHHNRTGEDNADAHMKRQIMGREVVVAITKGKLDFGPWEQIFYGEFDGNRRKRVLVKIIGE